MRSLKVVPLLLAIAAGMVFPAAAGAHHGSPLEGCLGDARTSTGLALVECIAGPDAGAPGLGGPAAPDAATGLSPCRQADRVNDACPAWVGTYGEANDTPGGSISQSPDDTASLVLLSADEQRLYVAGRSFAPGTTTYGWAVVAFDAATGAQLWTTRHDAGAAALPTALAESPDGGTLYVAGSAPRVSEPGTEFLTLSIDASSGTIEGQRRWHGEGDVAGTPAAVTPSPDGTRLYVGGSSWASGASDSSDYAVVAYDLVKDELRWAAEHDGGLGLYDLLNDMALAGGTIFVTGQSKASGGVWDSDAATLAIDAATGDLRWEQRRDGGTREIDAGNHLVASPDGSRVFVAGIFGRPGTGNSAFGPSAFLISDYAVLAYDAATGAEAWATRYRGPTPPISGLNVPSGMTIDDRGERVFVTGLSSGVVEYDFDAATIALDAGTGALAWEHRYGLPGHNYEYGAAVAYEPEQDRVYVSGSSATMAFTQFQIGKQSRAIALGIDAGSGGQVWAARYGGHGTDEDPKQTLDYDTATGVAVGTASRRLFVTGTFGKRTYNPANEERYAFRFGALSYALPGAGPALPDAGGWHSQNLEFVTHVPTNNDTAGAKIVGNYLYVTTSQHLKIYDISDPELPMLTGALAFPAEEEPYFAEEDPDTNGKILLVGSLVIDVTDKANPRVVGDLTRNQHTMTCVLDCTWAYGSEGVIIDIRNPAQPAVAGSWGGSGHDVTEVAPGIVMTATNPIKLLDARANPAAPTLLASGPQEPGQFNHGILWPHGATDDFFLVGGESGTTNNCSANKSAVLRTFDATHWQDDGTFTKLGSYTVRNGLYTSGDSPADLFCAHWFDPHPDYRNGGVVAMAWYEHGTRLLRVSDAGQIREIGFYVPYGGSTSAAYWANEEILYSLDYNRGFDILRYTGRG
ncbi:MAG TPA: PQQ-binding-like beta-propeller repeat protein [Actinomycetota bacterium]